MATESTGQTTGVISWTEIPAVDLDRVQAFYSTVFGWTSSASGHPDVAFFNQASTNGSFVKVKSAEDLLSPASHPDNPAKGRIAVRVTITVDNVDDALKEVEKAGGKLYIEKRQLPGDMGVVAYFTDTESNVLGLWSK